MEQDRHRPWPQPLTFTGVAEFAYASWGRLFLFELLVATAVALSIVVFFEQAWAPVINRTIAELPPDSEIRGGTLHWTAPRPLRPAGTPFLWIAIDPADSLEPSEGGDVQLEFGRSELRVRSLFGYVGVPYPTQYVIGFNRTELEPWWGAWHWPVVITAAIGVMLGLLVIWSALGLLYAWPARLISFYADRSMSWSGAWRVGIAALLPGAIFLTVAIVAYALQRINLVQLLAAEVGHLLIGWIYLLFAPFCLRREPAVPKKKSNPFGAAKPKRANPFSRGDSR